MTHEPDPNIDGTVIEWLIHKDDAYPRPDLLDKIIRDNTDFVRVCVSRVQNTVPSVIDFEDLVQAGLLALIESANRFDSTKGVPFRSWAYRRIVGAARDVIRSVSSTARSREVRYVQLSDVYAESDDTSLIDSGLSPEVSEHVRKALLDLPLRQGLIFLLSVNGVSQKQTAGILGISVTRVIQERNNGMLALRAILIEKVQDLVTL